MTEADLIRENAELTASIAGLREALICSRRHVRVLTEKLASKKMFVTYDKSEILSDAALTETPAVSLAAITAPLEARIEEWRAKYEAESEAYIDIFTQLSAYEKRDLDKQDAARAEERKAIEKEISEIEEGWRRQWLDHKKRFGDAKQKTIQAHAMACGLNDAVLVVRNRGNGGELKP